MMIVREVSPMFRPCQLRGTWAAFFDGRWVGIVMGNHIDRRYEEGTGEVITETMINADSRFVAMLTNGGYFRDMVVELLKKDIPKGLY